jgi:hypothetical protein
MAIPKNASAASKSWDFNRLPDIVRDRWGNDAASLSPPLNQPDNDSLNAASNIASRHLPPGLAEHLAAVMTSGPFFRVLENLPIGKCIPPVPTNGKRPTGKDWVSEATLLGTTRAIGLEAFTYLQERQGVIPQQVAPIHGQEAANHSGNTEEFGFHSDNAILQREHLAEFIALLGIRNDRNTETSLAALDDLLTELDTVSPSFVPVMEDPQQWQVPYPESFEMGADRKFSRPCSILTRAFDGRYEIAMAVYNVVPLTRDAEAVLEAVKALLKPPLVQTVVIRPGTLLIMSNFRGLHGRGKIAGSRWAQRIYLGRSLKALQAACGTGDDARVFDVRKLHHK